ncbi:hypothetical protein AVEN_172222-1 [Araneus ventricosus]|uniref:Uncharacterized protein n=1 Tax=Araneus ventricosus TaxID=182803 RepID=A0A4Y2US59_ARAVE|nr:hypothetical protein AVEN_172222-1 [Araneus ventricosus]
MECIVESIKLYVSSVLPHLPEETVNSVSTRLADEIGVITISDLSLVTSEDLIDLKPIDRRKLLRVWKPSETQNVLPTVPESHSDASSSRQDEMKVDNPTENWGTFCIPWKQMPVKLMSALEAGERPTHL